MCFSPTACETKSNFRDPRKNTTFEAQAAGHRPQHLQHILHKLETLVMNKPPILFQLICGSRTRDFLIRFLHYLRHRTRSWQSMAYHQPPSLQPERRTKPRLAQSINQNAGFDAKALYLTCALSRGMAPSLANSFAFSSCRSMSSSRFFASCEGVQCE